MACCWVKPALRLAMVLLSGLTTLTAASPLLEHEVQTLDIVHELARRQQSTNFTAVTGITTFGVHPRLEIRELEQNLDQWNIYLLGLARFMQTNQSDKLSFYRIAGIHGRPYIPWDGVPNAPGIDNPGYCNHVSNLFLPWHRPYTALYEQVLYQHIVEVVDEFPRGNLRNQYAAAAISFRAPYWDWAAPPATGTSVYPASVMQETVTIMMPNGTTQIANPLFSYHFHNVSAIDFYFDPFASWNNTKRYPTSWDQDATSQDSLVAKILDNNRVSFQDRLYNLFTNYDDFTEFGNEAWITANASNADSLESLHDAIHSITGSNGHMTYLDYSAFDPLFWLHHGMIDRCFALWQALYNDSYVEPFAAIEQTFTIPVGQHLNVHSPLEPFHSNTKGDFWTASQVRSTTTFGYTYSDLGDGSVAAVKSNINRLYGGSAGSGGLYKRSLSPASHDSAIIERELPAAALAETTTAAPDEVSDGKHHEYLANIVCDKFALNGSFGIYVFMGDFDDSNASSWPFAENLVGTHAVFAALSGADANTDPQAKMLKARSMRGGLPIHVTGSMPLTSMLLAKVQAGALSSMKPEVVVDYLVENLFWRVAMFDGTAVPVENLADLAVTVVSAEVAPATSAEEFPTWGPFVTVADSSGATQGGSCAKIVGSGSK